MKNADSGKPTSGKHVHRSPISMNNPEVRKDTDWWDEVCKAHGEKNHWPKRKTKKQKQDSDERKIEKK